MHIVCKIRHTDMQSLCNVHAFHGEQSQRYCLISLLKQYVVLHWQTEILKRMKDVLEHFIHHRTKPKTMWIVSVAFRWNAAAVVQSGGGTGIWSQALCCGWETSNLSSRNGLDHKFWWHVCQCKPLGISWPIRIENSSLFFGGFMSKPLIIRLLMWSGPFKCTEVQPSLISLKLSREIFP